LHPEIHAENVALLDMPRQLDGMDGQARQQMLMDLHLELYPKVLSLEIGYVQHAETWFTVREIRAESVVQWKLRNQPLSQKEPSQAIGYAHNVETCVTDPEIFVEYVGHLQLLAMHQPRK